MRKLRWRFASDYRGTRVALVQMLAKTALVSLLAGSAPAANLALQVSSETAPAGGWAQVKISATAPALIAGGRIVVNLDPAIFGPIAGVAVFSAKGDAIGVAVVNGESLDVNFESPSAGIGQLPDLPILTVTIPVLASAVTGTVTAITIDPSQGSWTDENGNTYTAFATPGSVTVGGSLSVQNLAPGGGLQAAGTLAQVNGTGFTTSTTVTIAGVSISKTQFVGQSEIIVALDAAADLTGKQVVLTNPDGSQTEFFSSIPSVPEQAPASLTAYQPLLSMQTWTSAVTYFPERGGGIALQNPNPVPVDVTLQTIGLGPAIAAQTAVTIPPGALQVYYTVAPTVTGGFAYNAFATLPLRMMGMGFQLPGPTNTQIITPELVSPTLPPLEQLTAAPTAVSFNWQIGTAIPAPASVYLEGSDFPFAVTWSGAPFSVSSIPANSPSPFTVAVNPVGLSPGSYNGSVTITPEGPSVVVTTIPLSLTVSDAALLNASSTSLTLAGPGVEGPSILSIASNGNPIPFTVAASSGPNPNWLSVSPTSGTTPAQLMVTANSSNLSSGVYNGQIVISGPNNTLTVPVQLTVSASNTFVFSQPSVTFSVQAGSAAPPAQTVTVYGPSTGLAFSVSTSSGGNWLSVSSGQASYMTVAANPSGLPAGAYAGAVTLTSPSSPVPVSFPVTLVIWNQRPTLTVSPSSFTFAVPEFTAPEPMQNLQVTSGGVPLNFATNAFGGTFTTPASIPVYAQGGTLGTNEFNVTITSGSQTVVVPVTTLITTGPATPPFLGSIVNAASEIPAAVSPGEILTIYGFGAGPSNAAGFTLNTAGNVATTLNGAQVLFDGNPAPMVYGSAYQSNVIVPYEVANQTTTTIALQFGGVTSGGWALPVVPAAPGIFTIGATGLGQGAVLNQDNSVNGASNPAARGSVIQIFATGEGQTSPPGVTGSVIVTGLKRPILPVTVSIGNQNAVVQYAGSAGDSVAGLLQVNAVVPQGVTPGAALPIVVSVGGIPSQGGVTVAVQ
jgi:uncharacterized protein (TIGR03437 family)